MDEPPEQGQAPTILSIRNAPRGQHRLLTLSDGREFLFSVETCERAHVSEGQDADAELLAALENLEQATNAHAIALRLLAHRQRSEKEMRTRLAMRGIAPAVVDAEIERLLAAGLLDDGHFARSWVESRNQNSPRGRQMLRYELLSRGIEPDEVDTVTSEIDDRAVALQLARRKAAALHSADYDQFMARVGGFLQRRGFHYEVVSEATRTAWAELQSPDPETADAL